MRELLVRCRPSGGQLAVTVLVATDTGAWRSFEVTGLFELDVARLRGVVDVLLPSLMPSLDVYWQGAPVAASGDDALAPDIVKRIGQVAKFARTLKLLPS